MLNAGFYKPALLARDVGAARPLRRAVRAWAGRRICARGVRGRRAALPKRPPARSTTWQHVTEYMREHLPRRADPDRGQRRPGADRGGAAGRTSSASREATERRRRRIRSPSGSTFVRSAAGDRFDELELNVAITAMPIDGSGMPDLSESPSLPARPDRRGTVAPRRACCPGRRSEMADTDPRLPGHLRRELYDRSGAARGGVLEGDRRTAVTKGVASGLKRRRREQLLVRRSTGPWACWSHCGGALSLRRLTRLWLPKAPSRAAAADRACARGSDRRVGAGRRPDCGPGRPLRMGLVIGVGGGDAMIHRLVCWIRRAYPQWAPHSGHMALVALCGHDESLVELKRRSAN